MKIKHILIASAAFLFFSCATDNGLQSTTTSPSSVSKGSEQIDPTAPQILSMGFSNSIGQSSVTKSKFKAGESAVLFLKLKDSEWDLSKITVVAEKNGVKEKPMNIQLDYQYEEEFTFAQGFTAPDQKGTWTFTVVAWDHRGNKSKEMTSVITVE